MVVNKEGKPALKQLIEQYEQTSASVVGVQTVAKKMLVNMELLNHQNHIQPKEDL